MIAKNLKPAAGYIRMSTGKQEASPERQRAEIEIAAKKYGYKLTRWFEDHGISGTKSENRPAFQDLLKLSASGKFCAVIVHEQSRFSREKMSRAFGHLSALSDHGVHLVTTRSGPMDINEIGGAVMAIVNAHQNHEYSRKLSEMSVSGKIRKAHRGEREVPLFGFDREIFDTEGRMVKRVHFRERFTKPKDWTTRFVVSADSEAVDAVRFMFKAVADGASIAAIEREMRRRNIKTLRGNPFTASTISRMIRNPAYAGILVAGRSSCGEFHRITRDGLIRTDGAHEAIISTGLFETVQAVLQAVKRPRAKPASCEHVLTRTIRCGHCGSPMRGNTVRRQGAETSRRYVCVRPHFADYDYCQVRPSIEASAIEGFIFKAMNTHLFDVNGIKPLVARVHQKDKASPASEHEEINRKLAELNRTKQSIVDRLLLVEANQTAMNAFLAKLEDTERDIAQLTLQLERLEQKTEVQPAALARIRDILSKPRIKNKDRARLMLALQATIKAIRIWRRWVPSLDTWGNCGVVLGEIEFADGVYSDIIQFTDLDLSPKLWRQYAGYVMDKGGRNVPLPELTEAFPGKDKRAIASALRAAVLEGSVIYNGSWAEGWRSNPDYDPFGDAKEGRVSVARGE